VRFEVNVDDGNNLDTLHKARARYNEQNAAASGFVPAADMPTFVQRLMDQAVAGSIEPFGPTTLSAALTKVAELEATNAALTTELAAAAQQPAQEKSDAQP
jgi:hypothetical protein